MSDVIRYVDPLPPETRSASFSPDESRILDAVNQKVAASESLSDILDDLFDQTRSISPCDRISLALLEEDGKRLRSHYSRAAYEPVLLRTGYAENPERGTLRDVIRKGCVRIIRDLPAYLKVRPSSPSTRLLVREGVRSSMTCPLRVDGRLVGVLFRSSRDVDVYTPHEAHLHLEVAERLSQAVEKTWRIEQLTEANKAYFEMLGFVVHELKSPLASMVMDIHTLTGGYLGDLQDPQKKKLEGMVRKADYLLSLVGEYLNLSRIEGDQMQLEARAGIDFLSDVLDPVEEMLRPQIAERETRIVRAVAAAPVSIEADPTLLRIVMVNLLGNAIKYGNQAGEVRLNVGIDEKEGLTVSVRNEGPGFSPAQRSRLFRKFSRLDSPELKKRKGTGVGLYTVWRIVKLHGGDVDARSEEGAWAEFSFRIPQPAPGESAGAQESAD